MSNKVIIADALLVGFWKGIMQKGFLNEVDGFSFHIEEDIEEHVKGKPKDARPRFKHYRYS